MTTLSPYARRVLQSATRALKEGAREGWVQGMDTDGAGRYCAVGRIRQADPFLTVHGTTPAGTEICRARFLAGLPGIAAVNDGAEFNGLTGYEGVVALMDHLLAITAPVLPVRQRVEA